MKYCNVYKTPIGSIKIVEEGEYIREVSFLEKSIVTIVKFFRKKWIKTIEIVYTM